MEEVFKKGRKAVNKKDIIKKIRNTVELQIALDDMVRDRFELMASEVNNQGIEAQIKWLEQNCGEDAQDIFEQAMENKE